MRAEILTIGDELCRGEIIDTNSAYLAERLWDLDITTRWMTSCNDHEADIVAALSALIFRLLDKDRRLLGWTETFGRAPGDGTLRTSPVYIIAEEDGEACSVNVHWPDMHVITESPINPIPVKAGQAMVVGRPDDVIFKFEGERRPLPPVTVRKSVAIEPPVGAVGVVGNR